MDIRYAKPGKDRKGVTLYEDVTKDGVTKRKAVRKILWGDWLKIAEQVGEYGRIAWNDKTYWVRMEDTQAERPLDIIFVDVGQGDGCFIAAPHPTGEKWIVVDAGADTNMYRFLRWRFGLDKKGRQVAMEAAVITHSDEDHYGGFQRLFDKDNLTFKTIYHNGIAERGGPDLFGPRADGWLTDIAVTHEQMEAIYSVPASRLTEKGGKKLYPKLMLSALKRGKATTEVRMLSTTAATIQDQRAWMPGFSPNESPDLTIEVLGPVVEPHASGEARLRTFDKTPEGNGFSPGHTKNGHSILLRIRYGEFSLLLGGDLNRSSEHFLLRHYSGIGPDEPLKMAVPEARKRLRSDMIKSCHHGSSDVTDEFLQAVEPCGFVVSSGDEEGHAHPRPDLLGRLGKHGRGEAPLILCTELLRSTREKEESGILKRLGALDQTIESPTSTPKQVDDARKARRTLLQKLAKRNVEVYGAITLRTDGKQMVVAFRHEDSKDKPSWQTFWYEHDATEGFRPIRSPDDH